MGNKFVRCDECFKASNIPKGPFTCMNICHEPPSLYEQRIAFLMAWHPRSDSLISTIARLIARDYIKEHHRRKEWERFIRYAAERNVIKQASRGSSSRRRSRSTRVVPVVIGNDDTLNSAAIGSEHFIP